MPIMMFDKFRYLSIHTFNIIGEDAAND
jgi:hypothetical protein